MVGGLRFVDQALDKSAGAGPTWLCRCQRVNPIDYTHCPNCGAHVRTGVRLQKVARNREIIRRRGGLERSKVDAAVDGLKREVQS